MKIQLRFRSLRQVYVERMEHLNLWLGKNVYDDDSSWPGLFNRFLLSLLCLFLLLVASCVHCFLHSLVFSRTRLNQPLVLLISFFCILFLFWCIYPAVNQSGHSLGLNSTLESDGFATRLHGYCMCFSMLVGYRSWVPLCIFCLLFSELIMLAPYGLANSCIFGSTWVSGFV